MRTNLSSIEALLKYCADAHQLSVGELVGPSRKAHIVAVRHAIARALYPKHTMRRIGSCLGGRDERGISRNLVQAGVRVTHDPAFASLCAWVDNYARANS